MRTCECGCGNEVSVTTVAALLTRPEAGNV